jgi:hypothetical protein
MCLYALATLDTILWSAISATTIVLMTFVGVFFRFVERFVKTISSWMVTKFTIPGRDPINPSLVSSGTPNFFHQYTDHLNMPDVWPSLGAILAESENSNAPKWDARVARFMLHLSALAYEHPFVVDDFAEKWNLEKFEVLKTEFACYIYYSTNYSFVVVAFKGTSPFDLSEWLTDVMMMKIRPQGDVLPGQVHEGFYNTFQWDTPRGAGWSRHHCAIDGIFKLLNETVMPRVHSSDKSINLWITGHSLGAALATVFLSHLTYHEGSPLDPKFKLRGAYTFGSPRVGDSTFASITNTRNANSDVSCFRVVNANDAIAALPLISTVPFAPHKFIRRMAGGREPNMITDFEHVGTPVLLGYDRRVHFEDRTWISIFHNTFGYIIEWPFYFYSLAVGRETLGGLVSRCLQTFPYDHTPSEYDRHLLPRP